MNVDEINIAYVEVRLWKVLIETASSCQYLTHVTCIIIAQQPEDINGWLAITRAWSNRIHVA